MTDEKITEYNGNAAEKGSALSQENDDPNGMAVLYKTAFSVQDGCAHAVRWKDIMDTFHNPQDSPKCPICQTPVNMICDMMVVTSDSSCAVDSTICFKYGKCVFQLSIHDSRKETSFLSRLSVSSNSGTTILAQDRIVQALDLDPKRLKILHKGKILYPPPPADTGNGDRSRHPHDVSKKILEITKQDLVQNGNGTKRHHKVSLVIMGSRRDKGDHNTTSLWTTIVSLATGIASLPYIIAKVSIQTTWLFVGTIFDPFLPERMRLNHGDADRHSDHQD
jgi:hypothetical protein